MIHAHEPNIVINIYLIFFCTFLIKFNQELGLSDSQEVAIIPWYLELIIGSLKEFSGSLHVPYPRH